MLSRQITLSHAGTMKPTLTKPPPSQRVWLVKSKRTYFGLHLPCRDAPDMTKTNLLAFSKAEDALMLRSMLCSHYACNGDWPTRIANSKDSLQFRLQTSPAARECSLDIDEYNFKDIVELASLEGMAVSLVEHFDTNNWSGKLQSYQAILPSSALAEHLECLLGQE